VGERERRAELVVTNTSLAIGPEDLPHLFQPFWRKDPARSDGGHAGLGLALVRAFASLLDAEVTLDLPSPQKVRARLSFPSARR
jgi:signal transduction histidine kinase